MLAYLIDEQAPAGGQASLDVVAVVPTPDDQGVWAQVAYEAAQALGPERWIPARRRRPEGCPRVPLGDQGHGSADHRPRAPAHPPCDRRARAQRGINAADLLEELVGRERDNALLAAMNEHFAGRSAHERARLAQERGAWERTLLDGLARPR